ncbi:MAG: 16S rRNA (cytosine(1402)-N(4))-methyltransferase RsmH [Thermoguttaceae bacterium]
MSHNHTEKPLLQQLSRHVPVLLEETITWLSPKINGSYVDGTLGAGGHTEAIARNVGPNGLVLGMDRDVGAIDRTQDRLNRQMQLEGVTWPIRYAHANYADMPDALEMLGIGQVDGILLDIGLSSDQLADDERGFSFDADGLLDLRFDVSEGMPAYELLDRLSEEEIANIIYEFGEERKSRRIAREICEHRRNNQPIRTSRELAELVRRCVPVSRRTDFSRGKRVATIDPGTRTFQALRIAVNDELGSLTRLIGQVAKYLKSGGRIVIISFHSLEDRIVKNGFRDTPELEVLTKKPVVASDAEIAKNPRARSAKLRVAQKK